MRIEQFVDTLRPHEASVAIALLELVRKADGRGSVERGEWLSAIAMDFRRLLGQGLLGNGASDEVTEGELARYCEENILSRLTNENIALAEPPGEGWERVAFVPAIWSEVEAERARAVETLETAVSNLLTTTPRAEREAAPARLENGSTLRAQGLVKAYRKRKVVNEVDIGVSQGEIVGLLGPNGAGKTTTFYMIVGLISPDEGAVYLDDDALTRVPMYQRARRGIGYLAQEPSVFRKLTVEQNIVAILETMDLPKHEKKARLERLLDELGLKRWWNERD